jgi:hypothetical protein
MVANWLIYNINTFKNVKHNDNNSKGYNNYQSNNYLRDWIIIDFIFSIGQGFGNLIGAFLKALG